MGPFRSAVVREKRVLLGSQGNDARYCMTPQTGRGFLKRIQNRINSRCNFHGGRLYAQCNNGFIVLTLRHADARLLNDAQPVFISG